MVFNSSVKKLVEMGNLSERNTTRRNGFLLFAPFVMHRGLDAQTARKGLPPDDRVGLRAGVVGRFQLTSKQRLGRLHLYFQSRVVLAYVKGLSKSLMAAFGHHELNRALWNVNEPAAPFGICFARV